MSSEAQKDAWKKPTPGARDSAAPPTASTPLQAPTTEIETSTNDASTNFLQTNIPQMTANSVSPAEHGKWICEMCTYENFPLSKKCTMCRAAKPFLGEDIFKLQDGASALPTSGAGAGAGAEAVAERLKPLRISSPPGHAGASAVYKWSCSTCTYENWPKSTKCAMCGTPHPAPHPSPHPAPHPAPAPAPAPAAETRPTRHSIGINEMCASETGAGGGAGGGAGVGTRRAHSDWLWLQACLGVVEGDARCVEAYLAGGGDPARALTPAEAQLLNRASAFDAGYTLVHLAIRFQRQEILSTLLSRISGGGPGLKRSPSYIAPDVAGAIRRHVAACVRHKQGSFPCRFLNEFCTFSLPADIEELPAAIQEQLFSELLDRDAQQTLEAEPPLINWSPELTVTLGSRLYALWNRSAGDCLPDAVSQAAYGVFDRNNALRRALADSLHHAHKSFYERWQAWECAQASLLQYAPEEGQLRAEWGRLLAAAARPGAALHQLHVFALAHVMRRPLIVYGVDVVSSFRGEALGYARFQGIYLPLLWEPAACSPSPLSLAYTRGHFSALVPLRPSRPSRPTRPSRPSHPSHPSRPSRPARTRAHVRREQQEDNEEMTFLPLTDSEGKLLPVHFLTCDEMSDEEGVVRRWVSACVTRGGVLAARQHLPARPLLQAQMLEEWLNHYRRLAQQSRGPFPPRLRPPAAAAAAPSPAAAADLSSGPETDDE